MSSADFAYAFVPNVARGCLRWLNFIDPALKEGFTEQSCCIDFGLQGLSQAASGKLTLLGVT